VVVLPLVGGGLVPRLLALFVLRHVVRGVDDTAGVLRA
jgi:hypothetical protein